MTIHPLLQTARGMLSDEIPHHEIDPVLARAVEAAKRLEDELARVGRIARDRDDVLFAIGRLIDKYEDETHDLASERRST